MGMINFGKFLIMMSIFSIFFLAGKINHKKFYTIVALITLEVTVGLWLITEYRNFCL